MDQCGFLAIGGREGWYVNRFVVEYFFGLRGDAVFGVGRCLASWGGVFGGSCSFLWGLWPGVSFTYSGGFLWLSRFTTFVHLGPPGSFKTVSKRFSGVGSWGSLSFGASSFSLASFSGEDFYSFMHSSAGKQLRCFVGLPLWSRTNSRAPSVAKWVIATRCLYSNSLYDGCSNDLKCFLLLPLVLGCLLVCFTRSSRAGCISLISEVSIFPWASLLVLSSCTRHSVSGFAGGSLVLTSSFLTSSGYLSTFGCSAGHVWSFSNRGGFRYKGVSLTFLGRTVTGSVLPFLLYSITFFYGVCSVLFAKLTVPYGNL